MTMPPKPPPAPAADLPTAMQSVLDKANYQSDSFHFSARAFRNRLVITSGVIIVVATSLVIIQSQLPTLPIFALPKDCAHDSRWAIMLLVMAFGSVGALVTAIPSMASIPRVNSPYNFPFQQSFVKIFLGALTAIVGVIAIGNAGVSNGFTSLQALLGVAIIFGSGQQAVTHYLDTRAQKIITSAP
jgi:hypothetical protein